MKDSILGPLAFNFVINDIFLKISAYLNLKVPKQEILAEIVLHIELFIFGKMFLKNTYIHTLYVRSYVFTFTE